MVAQVSPPAGRIRELDGLRGFAALLVVASHYAGEVKHGISALLLGWLGVDIFFVLSGFLMGSIILRRHAEPGFLQSFFLRRAARIIPIYFVVVCATVFAAALTQQQSWGDHPFTISIYLLFLTNIAMSIWDGGGEWLKPTWTLAVEEQFYLVLPLVVMWVRKHYLTIVLLGLCLAAVVFRYVSSDINTLAALTLLPSRMDLLLGGVILAYVWQKNVDLTRYLLTFRIIPLVALVMLLAVSAAAPDKDAFLILSPTLASIGITSFIVAVLLGAPEGRRYRWPVLVGAGKISYALYLVHQPISALLHGLILNSVPDIGNLSQIAVTCLAFATSVAVAASSWRWFEQPILNRVRSSSRDTIELSRNRELGTGAR